MVVKIRLYYCYDLSLSPNNVPVCQPRGRSPVYLAGVDGWAGPLTDDLEKFWFQLLYWSQRSVCLGGPSNAQISPACTSIPPSQGFDGHLVSLLTAMTYL